ncbi:O-antigen ligase family protein [Vibrio navarrensis]
MNLSPSYICGNNDAYIRSPLSFLIFIWLPLAVGNIDFLSLHPVLLPIQQLIIIFVYFSALLSFLSFFFLTRSVVFVFVFSSLLFLSLAFSYFSFGQVLQTASFSLMVVWAYILSSRVEFLLLVTYLDKLFRMFFVVSVIYSLIFYSDSFAYVNDVFSIDSFFDHKNTYGRFLFFAVFFLCFARYLGYREGNYRSLMLDKQFYFWLVIYFVFIFLTFSRTALFMSVFSVVFILFGSLIEKLSSFRYLFFVFFFLIFLSIGASFSFGWLYFENIGSALDCLMINQEYCLPLTGRATIWYNALQDLIYDGNLYFGYGLGYYFSVLSPLRLSGIGLGPFLPSDSHNGYVDLLLNFGVFGGFFLFLFLANLLLNLHKIDGVQRVFVVFFVFVFLLFNVTESFFVKSTNFTNFLLYYCFFLVLIGRYKS